jgi:hypothetical protein
MRTAYAPFSLTLLLLAPLAAPCAGTASNPPAPETRTSVVSLGDVRGSDSSSRLEIELELPDFPAGEVAAARLHIRKAVDDTGRDLVPEEDRKAALEPVQQGRSRGPDEKPAPVVVQVKLRNPARKAKVLAEVSGDIEFYLPGRDPNAVATIPNIPVWAGKRLESPALAASKVGIAMLTEEQLEAEKRRQAEKRKEEARKHGILGEMLEPLASAFLQAFFTPEGGDVVLMVEDPDGRVVRMALLDASGEDQTTGRMQQQGLTVLSSSRRGPRPDWSLEVRLKTPKTQVLRSFTLKDVRLP